MINFIIGDVVRLKSGGPHMTVEIESRDDERNPFRTGIQAAKYLCSWFNGTKREQGWFVADSLEKVE